MIRRAEYLFGMRQKWCFFFLLLAAEKKVPILVHSKTNICPKLFCQRFSRYSKFRFVLPNALSKLKKISLIALTAHTACTIKFVLHQVYKTFDNTKFNINLKSGVVDHFTEKRGLTKPKLIKGGSTTPNLGQTWPSRRWVFEYPLWIFEYNVETCTDDKHVPKYLANAVQWTTSKWM